MLLNWSSGHGFSLGGMFYIGAVLCLCFFYSAYILLCMCGLVVSPPSVCGVYLFLSIKKRKVSLSIESHLLVFLT